MELQQIYTDMGKREKKDFLDCGACGYSTCKDMAIAIFNNKNKINAICKIWNNRNRVRDGYYQQSTLDDKLNYLQKFYVSKGYEFLGQFDIKVRIYKSKEFKFYD